MNNGPKLSAGEITRKTAIAILKDARKVLLVEDDPDIQAIILQINELATDKGTQKEFLIAKNIAEARKCLSQHQDIDVILMDGMVPLDSSDVHGSHLTETVSFVKEIRPDFSGQIIAISGNINGKLIASGANHAIHKPDMSRVVMESVGLRP